MTSHERVVSTSGARAIETNKVIRNTYVLLSMTLAFSAVMAGVAMVSNAPPMPWFIVLAGYFGLLFLTNALRNSGWGLASVFALTGFMGYTLGPILSFYLTAVSNGSEIVLTAFGGTAAIFIGLSVYALSTRKDFSFMGGFLFAGILVAFLAGLGAMVFQMPGMMLGVSAMFILLMSALILYQTSAMIHGGETNYIMATVGLYIAIYNLFTSLLHLLMAFSGND
ncbi:Bax inhibitor-1/YccA family protein [Aquisalimonas asiatica]|uniref:Modulator of FtsH protease n=1 Tax=Aquisalimonas asiatica TaxID=406100 RepID=A0A1H8QB67_9GAMM|nr:Bax inhibitor-1/YccA family protein [Aquisalimonas asiatica]SEO51462.1 modulator of FtsH protease [Aquisalimonas asiatica]